MGQCCPGNKKNTKPPQGIQQVNIPAPRPVSNHQGISPESIELVLPHRLTQDQPIDSNSNEKNDIIPENMIIGRRQSNKSINSSSKEKQNSPAHLLQKESVSKANQQSLSIQKENVKLKRMDTRVDIKS